MSLFSALGTEVVRRFLLDLLVSVIPGDRVGIAASTENLVSDEHLLALSSILEKATLPLWKESIDRIEKSLH
jgi:hypothetical protein